VYQFFIRLSSGLLLVSSILCQAQSVSKVDSLKSLLNSQREEVDERSLELLLDLAYELIDVDNDQALLYARKAWNMSSELKDSLRMVKAGRYEGLILRKLDKMNEAIDILSSVLEISKRNGFKAEQKYLLNSLAIGYTFKADYDKALEYHFQSLIVREAEGDKSEVSITLNNIGFVYFRLKNYEKALEYYNKSLDLKRGSNDSYDLDRLLINIGLCHSQLRDYQAALRFINEGLSVCADNCSEQIKVEGQLGLGAALVELNKVDEAEGHFKLSYEIAKQINNKRFQAENLFNLSKIYVKKNLFGEAKNALLEAEEISKESGYNQLLIDTYQRFYMLFNKLEDFQNASLYQGKYIDLKDSIYSEELIKNLAKVQTDYAERENKAIIASKEQVIKQQRDLNFAIAIIAILAGLLILVLQRGNRNIKQVNAKLSEAKETIQEQNRLLEGKNKDLDRQVAEKTVDIERVNLSLKQVNDELDNFIYKTSHDIRGPLASLKGMCNVALLDVKDPIALDYLRKLDTTAERLNTILTRLLIINQINNSKLSVSPIDFEGVVNDVLMLERKKGLPQKLRISKRIDETASIHSDKELVRIVLENLIDNSIKFYNDSERVDSFVEVQIVALNGGAVKVSVIDNGIGISESNPGKLFQMFFRASERSEIGGIGLYIVKTATSKLGGRVGLQTTEEGYTEFYVTFPQYPSQADDIPEKGHFF